MKKNKNERIKLIALILVLCITLGYAALRTGLNINGTANVSSSSWNVYFSNYQMSNATNITPTEEPEIVGTTTTSISYEVDLDVPGDLYEFSVEVVNGGSLDALISLVSKYNGSEIGPSNPVPAYIEYVVSDGNGDPIVDNHRLNHGERETVKVFVKYKDDDASVLPTQDVPGLSFDIEIETVQAEKETATPGNYTLSFNGAEPTTYIGQAIPEGVTVFSTPAEAMAAWGDHTGTSGLFYLKHTLSNNIITASYIEFVITEEEAQQTRQKYLNENCSSYEEGAEGYDDCISDYYNLTPGTYTLRGAGASLIGENEYGESPYFTSNKNVIRTAFGGICDPDEVGYRVFCHTSNLDVQIYPNGEISVGQNNGKNCTIHTDGSSNCDGSSVDS